VSREAVPSPAASSRAAPIRVPDPSRAIAVSVFLAARDAALTAAFAPIFVTKDRAKIVSIHIQPHAVSGDVERRLHAGHDYPALRKRRLSGLD
tara:strand:- start:17 stop:295 length:279 start_codon:yes stop_codon:yes gene_type:complete